MATIDLTTALGRLLTDAPLRELFERDPLHAAKIMSLQESDIVPFIAISAHSLSAQADSLIEKRFNEAARLLPRTFAQLSGNARQVFRQYAGSYWPQGHKRHLKDAVRFCKYLHSQNSPALNRAEYNRARAAFSHRHLSVHLAREKYVDGRRRCMLQIFLRTRGHLRGWAFFLGL